MIRAVAHEVDGANRPAEGRAVHARNTSAVTSVKTTFTPSRSGCSNWKGTRASVVFAALQSGGRQIRAGVLRQPGGVRDGLGLRVGFAVETAIDGGEAEVQPGNSGSNCPISSYSASASSNFPSPS